MEDKRTSNGGGNAPPTPPAQPALRGPVPGPVTPPAVPAPDASRDAPEGASDAEAPGLVARAALGAARGAVASMAMTGLREFTRRAGLLEEPPPESIVRQRLLPAPLGRRRKTREGRRRAWIELLHWSYGAGGGAAFTALPAPIRRKPWAGPAYGLLVWGGFELVLAPALNLEQSKRIRPLDRAALALDHVLYGFVVAGLQRRNPE